MIKQHVFFIVGSIIVLLLLFVFGLRFYFQEIAHAGHMHFPLQSYGVFIEQPHIIDLQGTLHVRWVLPQRCQANAYEVVTSDSVEDRSWTDRFGDDNVTCVVENDGSFACTTPVTEHMTELLHKDFALWFVAKGLLCENNIEHVISERLIIAH